MNIKVKTKKHIHDHIQSETIAILFSNLPVALLGAFSISTIIFLELFALNAKGYLLNEFKLTAWYFTVEFILLLRYMLLLLFRKAKKENKETSLYVILFFVLASLTAMSFGIISSVLMPENILLQAFVLILISGIMAGSVQSLSANYSINITYVFLTLVPTLLWQAYQIFEGQIVYIGILISMSIFCFFSLIVARNNYNIQISNIKLKYENAMITKKIKKNATQDMLTGLFNRYYLNEYLELEINRSKRNNAHLIVFMIDIDHFKKFNDHYGHDIGDKVIRAVGSFLKKTIRSGDVTCRYGGDEFIVILTETTQETTKERTRKFLEAADKIYFKISKDITVKINLSIGMAIYPEEGETRSEILKAADKAMYQVKTSKYLVERKF